MSTENKETLPQEPVTPFIFYSTFSQAVYVQVILALLFFISFVTSMFPLGIAGGTLARQDVMTRGLVASIPSIIALGILMYNGFGEDARLSVLSTFIYFVSNSLVMFFAFISLLFFKEQVGLYPGVQRIHKGRIIYPLFVLFLINSAIAGYFAYVSGLKEPKEGFYSKDPVVLNVEKVPTTQKTFGGETGSLEFANDVEATKALKPSVHPDPEMNQENFTSTRTQPHTPGKPLFIYDPRLVDFFRANGNTSNENHIPNDFLEDFLNLRVQEDRQRKLIFGS
jgi:hypothetical protein